MQIKNSFFIALGMLSLALGIIGIFIPLLPTTPFLLLSAALFFRGSEKLYNWLMDHPLFGDYIRNFREHRAIPRKTKIFAVLTLWVVILSSAIFFVNRWWLRVMLILIALGVTIHILHYKTLENLPADQRPDRSAE